MNLKIPLLPLLRRGVIEVSGEGTSDDLMQVTGMITLHTGKMSYTPSCFLQGES